MIGLKAHMIISIKQKSPNLRAFLMLIINEGLSYGYSFEINYRQSFVYTVKVLCNRLGIVLNESLAQQGVFLVELVQFTQSNFFQHFLWFSFSSGLLFTYFNFT